jgi:transcriptional regulator with XRE-family HTH domain
MKREQLTTGYLIAYYRKLNSLKQYELACDLGVSQSKISDWENDKSSPSIKALIKLSGVLQISPIALIPNTVLETFDTTASEQTNTTDATIEAYKVTIEVLQELIRVKDETIELLKTRQHGLREGSRDEFR